MKKWHSTTATINGIGIYCDSIVYQPSVSDCLPALASQIESVNPGMLMLSGFDKTKFEQIGDPLMHYIKVQQNGVQERFQILGIESELENSITFVVPPSE